MANREENFDEIDLLPQLKKIYDNRHIILRILVFFSIIGIIYSFSLPVKYKSNIIFTPSSNNENFSSNLSGLASLAGIDLSTNSNNNLLSPNVYPLVFENIFFKRDILNIKLNDENFLKDHLLVKKNNLISTVISFTIGLPKKIIRLPSEFISLFRENHNFSDNTNNIEDIYIVSEEESELFELLDEIVFVSFNKREGYVEVFTELDNPVYSTIVTSNVQKILQTYIINHNIKSAKELLFFNKKNFNLKKIEFEQIQGKLSKFKDNNQAISSYIFNDKLFKLQNEFDLINSVYQELAKQVERAKIQVTKETPVFTIIKDVEVPLERSSPDRALTVLIFLFLGLITSLFYIFIKNNLLKMIHEIKSARY